MRKGLAVKDNCTVSEFFHDAVTFIWDHLSCLLSFVGLNLIGETDINTTTIRNT